MSRGRSPSHGGGRQGGGRAGGQRGGRGRTGGRGSPRRRREGADGSSRRRPDHLGGDVVEGRHAVRELLRVGRRRVRSVLVSEDATDSAAMAEIIDLCGDRRVEVQIVSRRRLDEAASTDAPQGVVANAEPIMPAELDELLGDGVPPGERTAVPFLVALDGVTDPGNLGALLRTAEVAGVTGVILPRHRATRLTPAATKAAAGAIEHLRIALVGGLPNALSVASERGVWVVGLDSGTDDSIYGLEVADEPIVLVLGAEGRGLGHLVRQRCDQIVAIPQRGRTESLNVAAAAAIACYEVDRRRHA